MPSGRSTTPRRTLKTAVLPPTPIASTSTALAVKLGERHNDLSARRRLFMRSLEAKPMPRRPTRNRGPLHAGLSGHGIAGPKNDHLGPAAPLCADWHELRSLFPRWPSPEEQ